MCFQAFLCLHKYVKGKIVGAYYELLSQCFFKNNSFFLTYSSLLQRQSNKPNQQCLSRSQLIGFLFLLALTAETVVMDTR